MPWPARPGSSGALCGRRRKKSAVFPCMQSAGDAPFLEGYLGEGSFTDAPTAALSLVRGALDSPDFAELFRGQPANRKPADPEDERIGTGLAVRFLAWQSIDFQLGDAGFHAPDAFTASYDGSSSALGIYYDPVLAC